MFKVLIAAILGGIIFFAWNSFSWTVLPWHQQTLKYFNNEQIVTETLKANIEKGGIYLIPKMDHNSDSADEANNHGPFAFISYQPNGMEKSMKDSMKYALFNSILVSILIVILLSCTSDLGYFARVFFVVMTGFIGALAGHVPNWIWWGFDTNYTIVMITDSLIGWFFAGLVIAAFVGREQKYGIGD